MITQILSSIGGTQVVIARVADVAMHAKVGHYIALNRLGCTLRELLFERPDKFGQGDPTEVRNITRIHRILNSFRTRLIRGWN